PLSPVPRRPLVCVAATLFSCVVSCEALQQSLGLKPSSTRVSFSGLHSPHPTYTMYTPPLTRLLASVAGQCHPS
ncbi:hypothetical protein DFH06DRAFT_1199326, partial [Mycena polygramma]